MNDLYWFGAGAFAVWRITHALHAEDGPGGVLAGLRDWVGGFGRGAIFDRFPCLSLFVALPVAWLIAGSSGEALLMWFALSGAACLFERLTTRAPRPAVAFQDQGGRPDGLL
jgi:hypothetical protein